jgi:hypothetical protein
MIIYLIPDSTQRDEVLMIRNKGLLKLQMAF